jgi:hypothetical protein
MLKTIFNRSSISIFALASGLAFGTAQAQVPVPAQTNIQADITINSGGYDSVVHSRLVNKLQACYNYATVVMATTPSHSVIVACSDSEGKLLSSADCEEDDGFSTYRMICQDTTNDTRAKLFPLTPDALKNGPVTSPRF